MQISVFCDFDATISVEDVGDAIFQEFGDFAKCWKNYYENHSSIKKLNEQLCHSLQKNLTYEKIAEFATKMEIDAYFIKFLDYCKENQINFTVVSDGYDAYIKPIFAAKNLNYFPVYCNFLKQNENGFYPEFFGAVESCTCSTASCKRNVVLNNSKDDDIIVYIGDGHTDFCGAEHSDIIFAKSKLAAYCNENKIPHHPFKSFFDIIRILDNSIKEKKIKQRNQALMKRKAAFEAE